jgi:hypothetical protein
MYIRSKSSHFKNFQPLERALAKMVKNINVGLLLLLSFCARAVLGQACSQSSVRLRSKLIIADVQENTEDNVKKLASCLGLPDCKLATYDFGQCGAARATRVDGATKAATVVLKPEGCTSVYSCGGMYVDTEVFNAVRSPLPTLRSSLRVCHFELRTKSITPSRCCDMCNL